MRVLLVAIAVAITGTASAFAGDSQIVDSFFHTPSKNISCLYSSDPASPPASLRCDIAGGIKPARPRAAYCTRDRGDWNTGYSLAPTGGARQVCASDTVMNPGGRTLAYGQSWQRGGYTCRSQASGLRCTNKTGHGFFLSRDHSYTF